MRLTAAFQSHIRLFLIIVIKVGKVYSSFDGCSNWIIHLMKVMSLTFKQTKKLLEATSHP